MNKKTARIFISFNLEVPFFNSLQQNLYSLSNCSRLVFVKNFHLTLKYLGEIDRNKIPEIISKLKTIMFSSFEIKTSDFGFFTKKNPRVVYIGLQKCEALEKIKHSIDAFFGVENFYPHITLSRIKNVSNVEQCTAVLQSIHAPKSISIKLDKFFLMESNLTSLGPIYTVIDCFNANI
ncbi:RNA 2',3'-cyclic phosphodiesterase [Candidatus Woesearchaeota archaeon]|nr:RNA 2',3'-cyclic phosphodiesterase [Candidatus Woesearchaeota archaeon]